MVDVCDVDISPPSIIVVCKSSLKPNDDDDDDVVVVVVVIVELLSLMPLEEEIFVVTHEVTLRSHSVGISQICNVHLL